MAKRGKKKAKQDNSKYEEAYQLVAQDSVMTIDQLPEALIALESEHLIEYAQLQFSNVEISMEEFVQTMTLLVKQDQQKEQIQKAFELFDIENTGKLTVQTLTEIVRQTNEQLTPEQVQDMVASADKSGNGYVSFEDFRKLAVEFVGEE